MKDRRYSKNASTILNGILAIVLVLVIIQLWLLMASMNAYLANDFTFIWPALGASLLCFLLNLGLLLYNK